MKRTVFILLMGSCVLPVFAAAKKAPSPQYYQEEAYTETRSGLAQERKFLFGIETRIAALTALGPNSPGYTTGVSSLNLLFVIPLVRNLTLHLQFRTAYPYSRMNSSLGNTLPMVFQSSLTMGFFVGLGGRIFDLRSEGRGWTIWMNAGFILDYGLKNYFFADARAYTLSETLYQMFSIGGEVNVQFVYHFAPRAAVFVSFFIDARGAPFAGDAFYTAYQNLQAPFALISGGAGVGFLF